MRNRNLKLKIIIVLIVLAVVCYVAIPIGRSLLKDKDASEAPKNATRLLYNYNQYF